MADCNQAENQAATPPTQAITAKVTRAGKGGIVPPAEHRFRPGVSGNPKGRPNAGLSVREQINRMASWKAADVQRVYDDPESTLAERSAAKAWLEAFTAETTAAGHARSGDGVDRIINHTDGKPMQRSEVTAIGGGTIDLTLLDPQELITFKVLLLKAAGQPIPDNLRLS